MRIILDSSDAIIGERAIKRYTINLIKEFSSDIYEDQFEIFLNYFRGDISLIDEIINNKQNFSKIPCRLPRRISLPYWKIVRFPYINTFSKKADIFHALGDDCPPVKTKNYIITLHGIAYFSRPDLINPSYLKMKQKWLNRMVKIADYFISVSKSTKYEFLDVYDFIDQEQVVSIPLGISEEFKILDTQFVKNILINKFNLDRPYILYVGVIEHHKNLDGIISGFFYISSQFPDLDLVLIGAQNNQQLYINDLIDELNLNDRIKILKYVAQDSIDLPVLYNGAECFIFPSFTEGWTSPPLEAMACGTPVITSNVSSLPETVGDAAFLVNPNQNEEIGEAIKTILTDSDLKTDLINKGIKRASQFTWEKCAKRTYNFYKEIVND